MNVLNILLRGHNNVGKSLLVCGLLNIEYFKKHLSNKIFLESSETTSKKNNVEHLKKINFIKKKNITKLLLSNNVDLVEVDFIIYILKSFSEIEIIKLVNTFKNNNNNVPIIICYNSESYNDDYNNLKKILEIILFDNNIINYDINNFIIINTELIYIYKIITNKIKITKNSCKNMINNIGENLYGSYKWSLIDDKKRLNILKAITNDILLISGYEKLINIINHTCSFEYQYYCLKNKLIKSYPILTEDETLENVIKKVNNISINLNKLKKQYNIEQRENIILLKIKKFMPAPEILRNITSTIIIIYLILSGNFEFRDFYDIIELLV